MLANDPTATYQAIIYRDDFPGKTDAELEAISAELTAVDTGLDLRLPRTDAADEIRRRRIVAVRAEQAFRKKFGRPSVRHFRM